MKRRPVEAAADIVLPITPMLDMTFQLLTFFIFTYNPAALEGQMPLTLPDKNDVAAKEPAAVDPMSQPNKEELPEMKIELIIMVKPHGLGGETPISVEAKSVKTPIADLPALKAHLKEIFNREKAAIDEDVKAVPPEKREELRKEKIGKLGIKVQPTSAVKWGKVVELMDACRAVGFTSVSFAKPPDYAL